MDVLTSETYIALNKEIKKASYIRLVFFIQQKVPMLFSGDKE